MTAPIATYPRLWESVSNYCKRLRVPGGWLVDVWNATNQHALCFMPDASHTWILDGENA